MTADHALKDLREKLGELNDVAAALSILHWDQQTYMPPKAGEGRGKQIATLSALRHRMFVSSEISDLLSELRGSIDSLAPDDRVLVEETAYDFDRATKLPEKFVQELAQTESDAFEAWVKAKKGSNFSLFQPHLEKLVDLQRQKSDYLGYEGDPYNALLEIYERGMTAEKVAEVFTAIGKAQGDLVHAISESTQLHFPWLDQEWKQQGQWDFGMKILADIGYDIQAGRQDLSEHPFTTTFGFHDVRVTTRVHEDDLFSALMSTLHEGGHALYEQGFLEKDARTPLAEAPSLGIHESQSRMWENMVGRSKAFWTWALPVANEHFDGAFKDIDLETFTKAMNTCTPSFIRVESDESTYNLHVMLRFELERAMISGDLAIKDLPGAWNEKFKSMLGLDVPSDAKGCLQDVHWSFGLIGYFPTYTLGNLYAAQMWETINEQIPDLDEQMSKGEFSALLDWLRVNIHQHGRRYSAAELCERSTGKPLSADPLMRHLESRVKPAYGL
ncbi:MAG: carboxypeptidase M32 [Candidatus Omnitrophica bacterium]|nr:carboxypeptidase M32 [Candidatus Omnitrophota bacterium]